MHQPTWTTPPIAVTGKDNYGFVAKYKKGATRPDGETEFQCKVCDINFHSTSLDWLLVSTIVGGPNNGAQKAWYQGSGTINGSGDYGFQVTVIDKGQIDYFRIKSTTRARRTRPSTTTIRAAPTVPTRSPSRRAETSLSTSSACPSAVDLPERARGRLPEPRGAGPPPNIEHVGCSTKAGLGGPAFAIPRGHAGRCPLRLAHYRVTR